MRSFLIRSAIIVLHPEKLIMNCLITIFCIRKQQFTSNCLPIYCVVLAVNNTAFKTYCLTRQPLDLSLHCILLRTKTSHLYMCSRSDSGCVRLSCRQGFPIFSSSLSLLFPKHSIANQEQYNHHQPALFLDSPRCPLFFLCCFIFFWKWNYFSCLTIFPIWE